jgi:hypothetical protein
MVVSNVNSLSTLQHAHQGNNISFWGRNSPVEASTDSGLGDEDDEHRGEEDSEDEFAIEAVQQAINDGRSAFDEQDYLETNVRLKEALT